jgi:hypothetical protein
VRNLFVLFVMMLASCGPRPSNHGLNDKNPFGEWSSGHGQTVFVRRDGTYKFCEGKVCEEGKHIPDGQWSVFLLGFADMKVTANLRKISGWDEGKKLSVWADDPIRGKFYSIGQTGQPQSMTDEMCGGRPCSRIGEGDDGKQYVFSKMKDY